MKKILLSLAVLICGVAANAQDYKPFKLGLGLGYTMPSDGGGGILFDLEPAYRLSDQIAVGLRIESAVMAKTISGTEAKASGNASYTLNGQYYLGNNTFRPYVGLGAGIFSIASVSVGGLEAVSKESKIGFYPRLGFDVGHFNMNLDYNIIGASEVETVTSIEIDSNGNAVTTTETLDIKNSYLGIRIGAFIFGGKN